MMKRKSLLAIVFLAVTMVGCARPLEKGWRKEDEGERATAIKNFSRALIDSEETYRKLAAEELIKIGEPAVPALRTVLLKKGHYYDLYYSGARKEAAWALGEIGSREAVLPLLTTLRTARESYQEEDLISEVKELSSRARLAKMVREVIGHAEEKKDQMAIAKTMEKYLEEVEKVIQVAFEDEDSFYREKELISAMNRIESLPWNGEEGKEVKEETLKIIKGRLEAKRTSGPSELIAGIEALGKIGDHRAVELLLDMLKETYTRSRAALALAKIGDRKAFPFLEEAWEKERQDSIKMSLEAALYLMGDESKWELLVERLREGELRRGAVQLLGEIGDKKGIGPLIEVLSDEYPEIRIEVVKALRRIGGREAEETLLRALNDKDLEVKKEAIFSVANSKKSMEALRKMLGNEGEELRIRLAAASRLGEWGDKSSLPLTLTVAEDNRSRDLSCSILIESLTNEGEHRIVKAVFAKKSFWRRIPRTYNEEMLIEAIDRIGRAQDKEVRIGLRKLFRERVDTRLREAQMRVIDKEGMDTAKLRSILKAAEEVSVARDKGEGILGEILGIDSERDEEAKRKLLSLRAALEKLESRSAIKMLLERLLDLKETFSNEEKAMALTALGRMGEGKEILREIYQDTGESYSIRSEARKALRMRG